MSLMFELASVFLHSRPAPCLAKTDYFLWQSYKTFFHFVNDNKLERFFTNKLDLPSLMFMSKTVA